MNVYCRDEAQELTTPFFFSGMCDVRAGNEVTVWLPNVTEISEGSVSTPILAIKGSLDKSCRDPHSTPQCFPFHFYPFFNARRVERRIRKDQDCLAWKISTRITEKMQENWEQA